MKKRGTMLEVYPKVGDVWEAPVSFETYLVVEIKKGYAWAVLLTKNAQVRRFHPMDGPISKSWTRIVSGEEA